MTHKELFAEYQRQLDWINRRLDPDSLAFYKEAPENWKHAKEVAFHMYESLRYSVRGGIPTHKQSFSYDRAPDVPPYRFDNGYECGCCGVLKYRGKKLPIYDDSYGMSEFVVLEGHVIQVDSFGGPTDWYFEIDRIIDKIDE